MEHDKEAGSKSTPGMVSDRNCLGEEDFRSQNKRLAEETIRESLAREILATADRLAALINLRDGTDSAILNLRVSQVDRLINLHVR